jgi:hypothetical protein
VKNHQSFYLFTGKGGVGKSTLSLAFTKFLRDQGVNASWVTIEQTSYDQFTSESLDNDWDIPKIKLNIEGCAEGYISKKLGSALVAKWITKTAFFRALVNMIPGFSYVILMGKMLDLIKNSPTPLTLVLDAPASGHALALLEATSNFKEIFQSGMLYEDTKKMLEQMHYPNFLNIFITTLPSELSYHESEELEKEIKKLGPFETHLLLNNSLLTWEKELSTAPKVLQDKLKFEKELIIESGGKFLAHFPYSTSVKANDLYKVFFSGLEKLISPNKRGSQ